MADSTDHAELTRLFVELVETSLPRAPLNAALCRAIAADPTIVALLSGAPPSQRQPVLLLAALHLLVLEQHDRSPGTAGSTAGRPASTPPDRDELAAWYPTVTERHRDPDDRALADALARFAAEHADSLRRIVGERHVQTNEIGRCALLLPAMAAAHRETGRPLAHLDVGTSAGLTLMLPRVTIEYDVDEHADGRSTHHRVGDGAIRLSCGVRGALEGGLPDTTPVIAASRGLDPRPIDAGDPDAVRWLLACCWPDEHDRFGRLREGLELRRSTPVEIDVGTAADVAESLARLDPEHHPVVTTTWVLNYADATERVRFLDRLDAVGRDRDLDWVFAESPVRTPELPHPPELADGDVTALVRVAWRGGARTVHHLARAHPHGHWMHALRRSA